MRISVLCSDPDHPIQTDLACWAKEWQGIHEIEIFCSKRHLTGGNLLFLVSCSEMIDSKVREMFDRTVVLHASDLPEGRGWSPHIWAIIEGKTEITITLLEAADRVDTGDIWNKAVIEIPRNAVGAEINALLFNAELDLMSWAIDNLERVQPQPQTKLIETTWPKRTPKDSELDPHLSIAQQFDLIRTSDPVRYPAFFKFRGREYDLQIIPRGDSA